MLVVFKLIFSSFENFKDCVCLEKDGNVILIKKSIIKVGFGNNV